MSTPFPKLSWAQNRRAIHLSILIKNHPDTLQQQHPSIILSNEKKTVSVQCQGCLPHEDPSEHLRNFDITLNLFASVLPISSSSQIKITNRYIRIILFKKAKKSWEKLVAAANNNVNTTAPVESAEHYMKTAKTSIIYDWGLDEVLEKQLEDALEDAGMAGQDFSSSDEDEFKSSDDDEDEDKENENSNATSGADAGGESGGASSAKNHLENRSKRKGVGSRKAKSTNKTSRLSKDPVYGDVSTTDTDSEEEEEKIIAGSAKEPENHNHGNNKKSSPVTSASSPSSNDNAEDTSSKQREKEELQKRMILGANRQFQEMNKRLPRGERRTLSDRNTLILVMIVSTICGLIGALLSGMVVYWNMSAAAVSPEILKQFATQQQKQQDL